MGLAKLMELYNQYQIRGVLKLN